MHSCLLVVNVIGTSISVGWSKYDIFYFFSKKLLASVVKVPAATSQLLFWTPTSVEWPQKSLEFQVRFIQSCYILGGQRDWGKGVHCGNVSVNNNANGFCFKRHTIHITANSHALGVSLTPAGWKLRSHASSRLWANFSRLIEKCELLPFCLTQFPKTC